MSLYSENLLYENLRYCIDISIYNIFERDLYRCLYTVGVKLREKERERYIVIRKRKEKRREERDRGGIFREVERIENLVSEHEPANERAL